MDLYGVAIYPYKRINNGTLIKHANAITESIKLILAAGANPCKPMELPFVREYQDARDKTPLQLAKDYKLGDIVKIFEDHLLEQTTKK
jgi:hypothetical protein